MKQNQTGVEHLDNGRNVLGIRFYKRIRLHSASAGVLGDTREVRTAPFIRNVSVSAKDQLEELSNEAHPTILFQRIPWGAFVPLKFSFVNYCNALLHKCYLAR